MIGTTGEWDQVVVGAGSAGAVVASRLAFSGRQRVLLLEAGGDQPVPREAPNPLRNGTRLILEGYNWDYQANLRTSNRMDDLIRASSRPSSATHSTAAGGQRPRALWERFPYRLGKVVGGSSSVNGAVALRGLPRDFDDWVASGNPNWSWKHVLPFYKEIESDADFAGSNHGQRGPIPIHRPRREQLHELDIAFWEECTRMGLTDLPDLNGGLDTGVGAVPSNAVQGERMDTAVTYLAAARKCPNLEVRTGSRVIRVVFEGHRVVGVEVVRDNHLTTIRARNVILSAGAIGSPVILIRSGIGRARLCSSLGISPLVDLPGVGENLVDHPSVVIWAKPKEGVCRPGIPWRQVAARMASGVDDEAADLQVWLLNNVEAAVIPGFANRLGWPMVVGISVMLLRPASRGRVFIEDGDPHSSPVIELAFGSVGDDIKRLAHGVRKAWSILQSPAFAIRLEQIQSWSDAMVADDNILRSAVRNVMSPGWHAVGSARMGRAADPMSVVDQDCRVHGIENLRIVDASVFPTMPSAPTNLTTIMLAEKIASGMKE